MIPINQSHHAQRVIDSRTSHLNFGAVRKIQRRYAVATTTTTTTKSVRFSQKKLPDNLTENRTYKKCVLCRDRSSGLQNLYPHRTPRGPPETRRASFPSPSEKPPPSQGGANGNIGNEAELYHRGGGGGGAGGGQADKAGTLEKRVTQDCPPADATSAGRSHLLCGPTKRKKPSLCTITHAPMLSSSS